jgi:hypothetical protein
LVVFLFGGGSLMMWGGMLLTVQNYVTTWLHNFQQDI